MIKGVLFDMDGVLFDTERPAAMADVLAAQKMGHTLPDEVVKKLPGGNAQFCKRVMMGHFGPTFDFDRFIELAHQEFENQLEEQGGLKPLPGVEQALAWIYQQGIPMCVASSTRIEKVERYLQQSRLRRFFTATVGGDMVSRSKPEPDIFIAAAKALNLAPSLCLAVEDSYNGVRSATAAGCTTVMIPDLLPPTDEMRGLTAAVLDDMSALPGFIRAKTAVKPN